MVAFVWPFSREIIVAFPETIVVNHQNFCLGGIVTAQYWVYFFLAVSALSLVVAFFFARAKTLLRRQYKTVAALLVLLLPAFASAKAEGGGEASLVLPDLSSVNFLGMDGRSLLMIGLLFCAGGLLFGLVIFRQLKNLPVHRSMREISELIYETCKTYLYTQGKFIVVLWAFIAVIISMYFGVQRGRHRGQLRGGVVWHSREHLCQLADGTRRIERQTVSMFCDSAEGRHERRHDADLR
jgi:hypothetical protein